MKKLGILSLVLLLATACNVYTDVVSTAASDAQFQKYRSFAWLSDKADTTNSRYNNEIIRNNIRNYFSKAMSDRGLQVNTEQPDLLLELVVQNTPHTITTRAYGDNYYYKRYYYRSVYYTPFHHHYYYVWYPNYYYSRPPHFTTDTHMNNAVTLNVIDAKDKKLVWIGSVEADIYDPSVINRDIHPAIEKLMNRFPLKPIDKRVAMR